jgi:hypothetical protein
MSLTNNISMENPTVDSSFTKDMSAVNFHVVFSNLI